MKLKTSFFNGSVLKKDITRFLPVWGLYSVFLAVTVLILGRNGYDPVDSMDTIIAATAVVNLVYALICAGTLFGDLFVPKMCNALHAMPMRREGWFFTHFTSGILFALVPNLLASVGGCFVLGEQYFLAFAWLGAAMLQFLFFLGLSLFCTFCAGSRLGLAAVYGIINFFVLFIYGLIEIVYLPLLKGVVMNWNGFQYGSPVVQMASSGYINIRFSEDLNHFVFKNFEQSGWNYLYIMAAVGVVFAALALVLYRRRNLECAGDFLAFRVLSPVFILIITLGGGLVFYLISDLFMNRGSYVMLVCGMAVGFFVSKMLLNRTVRVFTLKSIMGFAAVTVITLGSFYVTHLDPMKLTMKIPAADQIASCGIRVDAPMLELKPADTPEGIQEIRQLHHEMLESEPVNDSNAYTVSLTYNLKNGKTLERKYTVYTASALHKNLAAIQSSRNIVFGTDDAEKLLAETDSITLDYWANENNDRDWWNENIPVRYCQELVDALVKDCDEGNLAQGWMFHDINVAHINFETAQTDSYGVYYTRTLSLDISSDAVHTCEVIQKIVKEIPSALPDTELVD